MKFNTAIPPSAAVEHLFSIGKDILRATTAILSDANLWEVDVHEGEPPSCQDNRQGVRVQARMNGLV